MKTRKCDRCDQPLGNTHHTSWYNTQVICPTCRKKEMSRTDYDACRKAEHQAVLNGDLNFEFLTSWKEVHNG
jgi:hypothetical protein